MDLPNLLPHVNATLNATAMILLLYARVMIAQKRIERHKRAMLAATDRRHVIESLAPCLTPEQIIELRHATSAVFASPALIEYVQALLVASREHAEIRIGLSPRAGLALLAAARAHALLAGRAHALPEDVQAVFPFVASHRLTPGASAHGNRDKLALQILEATPIR